MIIGSSSQQASQNFNNPLSSFGPGGGIQSQHENHRLSENHVQASEVMHSVLDQYGQSNTPDYMN